jgi:hypothetical protein
VCYGVIGSPDQLLEVGRAEGTYVRSLNASRIPAKPCIQRMEYARMIKRREVDGLRCVALYTSERVRIP